MTSIMATTLGNITQEQELVLARATIIELTKAITDFREGNYADPRSYRPNDCPHGVRYWADCNDCDEAHWQSALKENRDE